MESNTNKKVLMNVMWKFMERCGTQGVSFVVSIILARMIEPAAYGVVAIITSLVTIFQVFVDSGLGNALIQKKDTDKIDFSSVFFVNIIFCAVLYALLYMLAPAIASLFDIAEYGPVIRVAGLVLLISGVHNVLQAHVIRALKLKKLLYSTLTGAVVGATIGITVAYMGYGVWALVVQIVVSQAVNTLVLLFIANWKPTLQFSVARVVQLFSYGWKLLLARLLDTTYQELRALIIGKIYHSDSLAFYERGIKLPKLIVTNIDTSIQSVLFPVMSAKQQDYERIRGMVKRAMKTSTYIMCPLMAGLAACAEPVIALLLTETWLPCVPYLRVFCINYAIVTFNTANQNCYQALGRSDIYLRNEFLCKVVGLISILSTMWISVYAMALATIPSTIIRQMINAHSNKKLINYGFWEQLRDITPNILLSAAMGGAVYCVQFLGLSTVITLILQVCFGVFLYILGSIVFRLDSWGFVKTNILQLFTRRQKVV